MILQNLSYLDYRKLLNTAVLDYPRSAQFLSFSQTVLLSACNSEKVSDDDFDRLVRLINILLLTYGV